MASRPSVLNQLDVALEVRSNMSPLTSPTLSSSMPPPSPVRSYYDAPVDSMARMASHKEPIFVDWQPGMDISEENRQSLLSPVNINIEAQTLMHQDSPFSTPGKNRSVKGGLLAGYGDADWEEGHALDGEVDVKSLQDDYKRWKQEMPEMPFLEG
eukprot:TRINITY_DN6501_c0_g1_i2.p1 TRINITY_DN6501_c0_g1~~TRINITY_DN6501_c0_g1_i2.p1  ORF type:complete len:181 (+),score=36.47 TRINITY_DN6501_c0_g1_i2:79-543(+)